MAKSARYVVATAKRWNVDAYETRRRELPGEWSLIGSREELTADRLARLEPKYVFFPHWSWIVPKDIVDRFECVCFHMTDVPYGRGGSPLQNLVLRGHSETKLTALRMTEVLDAGPVYMKKPLSLAGSAQEIYERASSLAFDMIREIVEKEPVPVQQTGEVTSFPRRTPAESELPKSGSPKDLYDFIRMLDADTYPHAFLAWGDTSLQFTEADLKDGTLTAKVTFAARSKKNG